MFFFFFKQKTAYEMRISDWSSDVCSSDLIHQLSTRKHGPFIAVNCGAIPEGTIDSELFGHEKGSFTGAHEARKGYFEVVNGGTIFLDEVAELPVGTQARLQIGRAHV